MILYNPIKNTLSSNNKTLKIGYRESQILTLLLNCTPDIVKKKDIIQFAWGNEYIGETSLAKSISVLRQAFVKMGLKDSPIITIPKIGYRLVEGILVNECLPKEDISKNSISKSNLAGINVEKGNKEKSKSESGDVKNNEEYPSYFQFIHSHMLNYKALIKHKELGCYLVSTSILFATFLVGLSKFHNKYSLPQSSALLHKDTVGILEVYLAPSTPLTARTQEFLTQNQCQCIVYIEENESFSELSLLYKKTQKSINVFYRPEQFEQASKVLAQFIVEEGE